MVAKMYDEAFKSVLIANEARLNLSQNHLKITQGENEAMIFLKDIAIIVLESHHITLTSTLLNALVAHKIVLLSCDESHQINGIFTPFAGHFMSAKIAREQLAVSAQTKAILWQKIVKNKILNQAEILRQDSHENAQNELVELSKRVALNDGTNAEATAAVIYFKALFGAKFSRDKVCFINAALNYGYAIVRACVTRAVCISGLLTWAGIKHSNLYNAFSLCDDIIEPFRPFVDRIVLDLAKNPPSDEALRKEDKRALIEVLHAKAKIGGQNLALNRAVNRFVQSFKSALLEGEKIVSVKFDE